MPPAVSRILSVPPVLALAAAVVALAAARGDRRCAAASCARQRRDRSFQEHERAHVCSFSLSRQGFCSAISPHGSFSYPRVERVVEPVAKEIERQHGQQQRMPGKSMYHQAVSKIDVASASIWPQLAFGGWIPTPRNDSAASNRMFCGITSVE